LKTKIAFIIVTYNSEKYIENCLKSITDFKNIDYEIFIIDNASRDRTVSILEEKKNEKFHIKLLTKNFGPSKGRNIGLKQIDDTFDYICILDSDTIVNEDAFEKLILKLKKDDGIGIIGPQLIDSKCKKQISGRMLPTPKEKLLKILPFKILQNNGEALEKINSSKNTYDVGYLISACWLIPLNVFKKVGLLDEKIFYGAEDAEYCVRVWMNDYKIVFTNEVSIVHEWQRVSRKKFISKINYEHIKGLIYFWTKYKLRKLKEINKRICNGK